MNEKGIHKHIHLNIFLFLVTITASAQNLMKWIDCCTMGFTQRDSSSFTFKMITWSTYINQCLSNLAHNSVLYHKAIVIYSIIVTLCLGFYVMLKVERAVCRSNPEQSEGSTEP